MQLAYRSMALTNQKLSHVNCGRIRNILHTHPQSRDKSRHHVFAPTGVSCVKSRKKPRIEAIRIVTLK